VWEMESECLVSIAMDDHGWVERYRKVEGIDVSKLLGMLVYHL